MGLVRRNRALSAIKPVCLRSKPLPRLLPWYYEGMEENPHKAPKEQGVTPPATPIAWLQVVAIITLPLLWTWLGAGIGAAIGLDWTAEPPEPSPWHAAIGAVIGLLSAVGYLAIPWPKCVPKAPALRQEPETRFSLDKAANGIITIPHGGLRPRRD
jgi:hypothetical protein